MIQNTRTGMASVAGTSLYYELTGEGPTLVLAHANPADHTLWDNQMDALSAHYRVLRYDQRDVGQSEGAAGPFSHHEDLNGLLETLGIQQAHFIGLSNGSMVVTDFAVSYPDKVLSLVLTSPAVSGFEFSGEPPQTLVALWTALGQGDLENAAEVATRIWADGPSRTPEQVDPGFRGRFKRMAREELKSMLPDAEQPQQLEPPALGRLGEITVPTLIILGDKDDPSISEIGETLHTGIGGSKKVVISGAAHMLNMEEPEAFNQAVMDFLERQRASA